MIAVNSVADKQSLNKVFGIRELVFVQEQKVPRDAEYDEHEENAQHYLATYQGVPCGAARWRKTPNGIKLERFAVLPDFRNKAVGSHILQRVLADVRQAYPNELIYLHAQLPAVAFYTRHGFVPEGEMFSECDIEHYKMYLHG
jgi:predicted GNAT family N-acyltransferase